MKKILAFCLLISLLIGLVGCGKKAHIVFPFAASDVTKIEVIYKDGESDAQKKTVNKETEIDSLYKSYINLFPSFPFKKKIVHLLILLEVLYLLFI